MSHGYYGDLQCSMYCDDWSLLSKECSEGIVKGAVTVRWRPSTITFHERKFGVAFSAKFTTFIDEQKY
jgi:hypothetical protein